MSDPGTGYLANGTEGDAWQEAWCQTCSFDINEDCLILMQALMGGRPEQWRRGPHWSPQTVVSCDDYERRDIL